MQKILAAEIHHRVAIAGVVRKADTEQAIAGARIEVTGQNLQHRLQGSLQTQSRPDGSFYFIDLNPGSYLLNVSAPQLGRRDGSVEGLEVTVTADGRFDWTTVALPPTSSPVNA